MNDFLTFAFQYKDLGISTIATDTNKRSVQQWKKYQEAIATEEDLAAMFGNKKTEGIAVICGAVSGNLEVIDVDCKYDLTGSLFEDFMQLIVDDLPEVAGKLVIAKTKGGGYHILYRCDTIDGNLKLARRHTTDEERKADPHDKVRVLIETRGEGGYIIASPSEGYSFLHDRGAADIPTISPEQRAAIFECARSFNQVIEQVSHQHAYVEQKSYNKSPFQDYNERGDIIGLLISHGWKLVRDDGNKAYFQRPGNTTARTSGDYCREKGIFAVFTTSSEFEPQKGYRPCAVFCMLECGGIEQSHWKTAAKKLFDAGYGEPFKKVSKDIKKFIKKSLADGLEGEQLQAKVVTKFGLTMEDAQKSIDSVSHDEVAADGEFWSYNPDAEKVSISYVKFASFLESKGFGLYFYSNSSTIFKMVHNDNNRLEEATTESIKKFIKGHVLQYDLLGVSFTKEQLLEVLYKNSNLFSDNTYHWMQSVNLDFLRDTPNTCYFPFKNGIVEITKSGYDLKSYGQVNKVIWKSDIIKATIDIDMSDDFDCEYSDFIGKACGNDADRILNACSIIGYLLHKYKHPAKAFAVIVGEETEDESKGGGTGKGIFVKAIEKMMPVETIDGKSFKPDKSFAYQRVKLETKLVVIQDAEKSFPFEKLYSIITEGITIEKKNQDELYIAYADSPKIMVTTNFTVPDSGNHAKRRQKVVEFSNYFGPDRSPEDEYGHLLFDDWDADEWNRFYNFMFYCVRLYLLRGITDFAQGERYKQKKIKGQYGEEFLEWFADYAAGGSTELQELNLLYNDFLNINNFDKKDYSPKRFNAALKMSAENLGYTLDIRKNRQMNGKRFVRIEKSTA